MRTKTYRKIFRELLLLAAIALSIAIVSPEVSSEAGFVFMEGQASWYSEFSPGILPTTANMEKFDHTKMTCATWGIPFNTVLKVTNTRNGKCVFVRVNDRGPAKRLFKQGRVVDLTLAAFRQIEDLDKGIADVRVKIVKTPN